MQDTESEIPSSNDVAVKPKGGVCTKDDESDQTSVESEDVISSAEKKEVIAAAVNSESDTDSSSSDSDTDEEEV